MKKLKYFLSFAVMTVMMVMSVSCSNEESESVTPPTNEKARLMVFPKRSDTRIIRTILINIALSEHFGMYIAWQNNLCFADNFEPDPLYNNIHELNGSNVLNLDVVSTIQFGIVFEFAKEKKICKFCKEKL